MTTTASSSNPADVPSSAPPDPRPFYAASAEWVVSLIDGTTTSQYDLPTPCTGWDVRTLTAHLIGTVERAEGIAVHGSFEAVSADGPRLADDAEWVDAFRDAWAAQQSAWSDDALLDRVVSVPWGEVPGRIALVGYVRELLVHGWDLAVATGQPAEFDAAFIAPILERSSEFLPAGIRLAAGVPFDEPAEPVAGAGTLEQLANWFGHTRG